MEILANVRFFHFLPESRLTEIGQMRSMNLDAVASARERDENARKENA